MIGVIADDIVYSPQSYFLFKALNELSVSNDCYLFASSVQHLPMNNNFAIMQQLEALHHPGILISTSMMNTQILAHSLTASKKYYYMWSFEWCALKQFGANQLDHIFHNDEINIIARSNTHADKVAQLFKPTVGVAYNWNAKQIQKVLS